jgi:hypothetical protein
MKGRMSPDGASRGLARQVSHPAGTLRMRILLQEDAAASFGWEISMDLFESGPTPARIGPGRMCHLGPRIPARISG